jgi:hypothetical protein
MINNVRLRTGGVNYGLSKVSKHLVAAGPVAALPGPLRVYRRRAVTRHRVFFERMGIQGWVTSAGTERSTSLGSLVLAMT